MTIGRRHENLVLALCVLFLAVLGLVMIYSATNVMAGSSARCGYDPAYFLKRQILFLFGGVLAAMGLARLDHDFYRRRIGWFVAASFLLLLLVYLPGIRHSANGASRWISLRYFTFQPSEFAKFVLLAFAAWGVDRHGESPKTGYRAFLPLLAVMGVFVVVILKEPDFGMAVVILVSFLAMVFIAGFPWKHLAACTVLEAAGAAVLILSRPYRVARIHAFLDPISQARTAGYQVVQSLIAFSNGGLLGTGVGGGRQKLFYLPEMHTDYIFSVIGEELGFAGVTLVAACFATVVWVGYRIARRARDPFGKYLAMGVSSVIGIQALMNMMVGLSMLPPKGMVLPFLSYGGSSLVLHMAAVGVLMNVSLKGADGIVTADDRRRRRDRRARVPGDRAC